MTRIICRKRVRKRLPIWSFRPCLRISESSFSKAVVPSRKLQDGSGWKLLRQSSSNWAGCFCRSAWLFFCGVAFCAEGNAPKREALSLIVKQHLAALHRRQDLFAFRIRNNHRPSKRPEIQNFGKNTHRMFSRFFPAVSDGNLLFRSDKMLCYIR